MFSPNKAQSNVCLVDDFSVLIKALLLHHVSKIDQCQRVMGHFQLFPLPLIPYSGKFSKVLIIFAVFMDEGETAKF